METKIINGKEIADLVKRRVQKELATLPRLSLAVLMVGDNPVSERYVQVKARLGEELGVDVRVYQYEESIEVEELKAEIEKISINKEIDGLILQLPLPPLFPTDDILSIIPSHKDVDALSLDPLVLSPVVGSVEEIINLAGVKLDGLSATVVGRGRLVGRPVAVWLASKGVNVSQVLSVENEKDKLKMADLVVTGVGKPNIIKPDYLKSGVVLIDAATSEDGGRLRGDADPACALVASVFTPVPGGVGPITLVKLFDNLVQLAKRHH